jgi:hypothetical protein
MRSRPGLRAVFPGAVCLLGVGAMTWASFLPFMGIPYWGGGLALDNQPPVFPMSLTDLWDARVIVVALPLFAVMAISHLARIRPSITAVTCLVASVAAVLFALFEVSDGGHRILPSWVFPLPTGDPETATAGVGFYLFLAGAALAVIGSLMMVMTTFSRSRPSTDARFHPLPSR